MGMMMDILCMKNKLTKFGESSGLTEWSNSHKFDRSSLSYDGTMKSNLPITFDDGAGYERYMGRWSQRVGEAFLDWLAPKPALRWLDVGCGNGAFTEMIVKRCAPLSVDGIDPADGQLAFARAQSALRSVRFQQADAMSLPFSEGMFDAAVMPLVIFFVPDPLKGVSEMTRVVSRGGVVAAYAWDLPGGGFPYQLLQAEMRALGAPVGGPPHPDASDLEKLRYAWTAAGLEAVETHVITVQRTFSDFDDYWAAVQKGPSLVRGLTSLPPDKFQSLRTRMKNHLPSDPTGCITLSARAHAVKGYVR
jgi:ubiquinone/menaquinone biosynthesis C-methylase UbiE